MWITAEEKDKHKAALGNSEANDSTSAILTLSYYHFGAQLIKINKCICFDLDFRPSLNSTKAFLHRFTEDKVNNLKLARHTVHIVLAM